MTRLMQALGALVILVSGGAFADAPFEFGQVMQGDNVRHRFTLANDSAETARIASVELAPSLRLARTPAVIPPHESVSLDVTLDTSKVQGDYTGKMLVALAGGGEHEFALSGTVVVPLEVLPIPAFFISTSKGAAKSASVEIVNREPQAVDLSLAAQPRALDVKLEPIEPGRRFRLEVSLPADLPAGRKSDRIRIATTSTRKPQLTVAVNTLVRERVYTFPDNVDLGELHRNELASNAQMLMVYQTGGEAFDVTAQSDVPGLDIRIERAKSGDRAQLILSLAPGKARPGPLAGTLVLKTNDREFPELRIPVSGAVLPDE